MHNVTLEARFEIIAPMFAGGEKVASGRTEAEIRPTAIKGALRFWWRALAWGRLGSDLERLKREEDALFGAAADTESNDRGQAAFLMRLTARPTEKQDVCGVDLFSFDGTNKELPGGIQYLGYGPVVRSEKEGEDKARVRIERSWVKPGATFGIEVRLRPSICIARRKKNKSEASEDEKTAVVIELADAIKAFGLLGGLGARSRRGFGSVRLLSLTEDGQSKFTVPDDEAGYIKAIRGLVGAPQRRPSKDEPGWTAFSGGPPRQHDGSNELRGTLCAILEPGDKAPSANNSEGLRSEPLKNKFRQSLDGPLHVLDMLGTRMLLYRGWGRNGKIAAGDLPAWKQFKEDHDWFKGTLKQPEHFHPERISFGLPHNYYSAGGRKAKVEPRSSNHCGDRRSSPLVFHVHRLGSEFIGVATIFPGIFLPKDAKLGLEHSKEDYDDVSPSANYGVLFDMIDGDGRNGRRQSPFKPKMILDGWGTGVQSGEEGGHDG